jgi:tetratricopeptide (TPR) repeat protein
MQTVTQHGRTAKDRFELVIRLQQSRGSQPSDVGLRLRAQALLKDILLSRLAVEAEINAHEYVHTQGFDDLGRALAASRALQLAFEGFRAVVPAARANVSVVLDSSVPDESAPAQGSLSVEQKDLLDFAKPSQVLITQAFYDRIAHYQPALRTFPLRAGVYEFLWTSEQRLDELQAEAEFMPTLIQPPAATEAFDETVVVPVIKPPAAEPRWKAPDPKPAPVPLPILEIDDPPRARWLSTPKVLMISGVAGVLFAAGYLVNSGVLGKSPKPVVESSAGVQQPAVPLPQAPQTVQADPNPRATTPPPAAKEKAAVPPPPKPVKPSTEADRGATLQTTPAKTARGRNCTLDDGEIPSYLNLAERYRNSGKYERAISNYNLVLGCQPSNRQAQAGLKTAEEMEKYSH